jgi:monovalent cation:proton antiporter-2 (CPA2) family protein
MEHGSFLPAALLLLGSMVLAVPLAQRAGLGSVPGYLLAGILVGPSVLGLVDEHELIAVAGEFGVVFLLFVTGIELSPARLWLLRRLVFGLGGLQVLATAAVIGVLALAVGAGREAALIIGFGLALSSTALVLQVLAERKELGTPAGRAGLSVLLLQDVAVAPLVSLVYFLGPDDPNASAQDPLLGPLRSLALLAVFLVAGRFLLRRALPVVAQSRNADILVATAVLLVLGAAWLMQEAGFSMALGAFLAGVLLADSPYRHQVVADIQPFRGILLGLFFLTVGMSLDVAAALERWHVLLMLTCGFMVLKAAIMTAAARLFGLPLDQAVRTGLQLSQGGEFALVLFALALGQGIFDAQLHALLLQMLVLSLLLAPLGFLVGDLLARRFQDAANPLLDVIEVEPDLEGHVLLCGYGRVGSQLGNVLEAAGLRWVAADMRPETVQLARLAGLPVYFGDASRPSILESLRVEHAVLAIVTLDDADAAERSVHAIRRHAPDCRILVRSPDLQHADLLLKHGATRAVPETSEYSLQLGLAGLAELGVEAQRLEEIETAFREEGYSRLHANRAGIPQRR